MINTLLDISGSARPVAAVQNIASSQNSLERKAAYKAEVAKVERQQDLGVDKASLVAAVKKLNDFVAPALQTIQFELDQQTERMVVKVVDVASHQVLRQIPNEEVLAMSKTLDRLQGLVIRQTA